MTRIAYIDGKVQRGRGKASNVLGQTYTVQRLSAAVNGSITNASPLYTGFPASVAKASKMKIENQTFDLQVFTATCDNRNLQIGDLLTETGYGSDGGAFTLAQKRPLRETILVRTESSITITRPKPAGGQASQQPLQGSTIAPGYLGVNKAGEWPLTLANGMYAFEPTGSPAVVPCGLQPLNRVRDGAKGDAAGRLPTALYREHFLAYLPLLPGETLNELDRLNFGNSDRYEVALFFTSAQRGFSGYICIVEKLST